MANHKLLSIREAADRLRCHPSTVRRLINTGRLRATRIVAGPGSGRNLLHVSEIEQLLQKSGLPPELARDAAGSKP